MPKETQATQNQKEISALKTSIAVIETNQQAMLQSINEIKNNHLLHINDELRLLNTAIATNATNTLEQIGEVYKQITSLKISDAKQEPTQSIISEVIKFAILALVGGGVAYLIGNH